MSAWAAVLAAVTIAVLGTGGGSACPAPKVARTPQAKTVLLPVHDTPPTTVVAAPHVSVVAQALVPSVAVYGSAAGGTPAQTLANPQPDGTSLVFLVTEARGDWLHVLLPVRPNGSTGWIKASQVKLSQHDFRIVVELSAHRITVYQGDAVFDQEPIGVGTQDTPTPGGLYYTKELLRPPDPTGPYGPYAYGLSGYSDAVPNFAGGDGVIGIHGTNDPTSLGRNASHGCIRMSNAGISKLAQTLPLGVPVEIRA